MIENTELNLFEIEREVTSLENRSILFKPILCDIRDFSVVNNIFNEFKPQSSFSCSCV